jgi:hypothetical protein
MTPGHSAEDGEENQMVSYRVKENAVPRCALIAVIKSRGKKRTTFHNKVT